MQPLISWNVSVNVQLHIPGALIPRPHNPLPHTTPHPPAFRCIVQELCESRGGRPGLSVLTSLLVSVDVKIY